MASADMWTQLEGVAPRLTPGDTKKEHVLAWNDHGWVSVLPDRGLIDIRHSDILTGGTSTSVKVADHSSANLASVSSTAACLASTEPQGGGPKIEIHVKEPWNDKRIFHAALGPGESPVAVACGDEFVACLTSQRLLRIFSLSGLALQQLCVPGDAVALAARGACLLVVTSVPGQGGSSLDYRLVDVRRRHELAAGALPLTPGARLRWLGLAVDYAAVTVDTAGAARSLLLSGEGGWSRASGAATWAPTLECLSAEGGAAPWVVNGGMASLRCADVRPTAEATHAEAAVALLGAELREVPWQLPVAPLVGNTTAEECLRLRLYEQHVDAVVCHTPLQKADVPTKLLNGAARAFGLYGMLAKEGELEQALSVAEVFVKEAKNAAKSLPLAELFAEKAGKQRLADKVKALSEPPAKVARVQ